jgi:hypothetical protein
MFKRYNNHLDTITLPSGAVVSGVKRTVYDDAKGLATVRVDDHPGSTSVHDWLVPVAPLVVEATSAHAARTEHARKNQSASKSSAHPTRHTPTK